MRLSDSFRTYCINTGWIELVTSIDFYSGAMPTSAETLPTGTLLARARKFYQPNGPENPGVGEFVWDLTSAGTVKAKPCTAYGVVIAGDVQSVAAIATGTIGYAFLGSGTAGLQPTRNFLLYATVGAANAEIIVGSTSITAGNSITIKTLQMSIPVS